MLITPGYELPQRESFKITYTLMEEIKQQTESRKDRCTDTQHVPAAAGGRKRVLLTSRVGGKDGNGVSKNTRSPQRERGGRPFPAERTVELFLKLRILFDNYCPQNFW